MKTIFKTGWVLAILLLAVYGKAQTYTEITGHITIYPGTGATEISRYLYIGPNAVVNVLGQWRIASEYVYISPTARITGNGTIVFDEPGSYMVNGNPLTWGTQMVDPGACEVPCDVHVRNPDGVVLMALTAPTALGYPADTKTDLSISGRLLFSDTSMAGSQIVNNNLITGDATVVFKANGMVGNYSPQHFIVTNGNGACAKDSLGAAGFIFPVGITPGDYTPAHVVNYGMVDRFDVRVLSGVQPNYMPQNAAGRTWDIREAIAGGSDASVTLQHNVTTGYGGPATGGVAYNDQNAYISTSASAGPDWDTYPTGAGMQPATLTLGQVVGNASMLNRSGINDFTVRTRFTKFTPVMPANLKLVKTAIPDTVYLGDNFNYHIVLTNTSNASKQGPFVVTDTLPAGAQYVGAAGSGWVISVTNSIVTATYAADLAADSSAAFDITVKAAGENLDNIAYVNDGGNSQPSAPCDTCTPGQPTAPVLLNPELVFPDAFSPNGDGVNDVLVIPGLNVYYPEADIAVYNRWGDKVWYSKTGYKNDFDGRNYGGAILPDGTYYYVVDFNRDDKKPKTQFVNISR